MKFVEFIYLKVREGIFLVLPNVKDQFSLFFLKEIDNNWAGTINPKNISFFNNRNGKMNL